MQRPPLHIYSALQRQHPVHRLDKRHRKTPCRTQRRQRRQIHETANTGGTGARGILRHKGGGHAPGVRHQAAYPQGEAGTDSRTLIVVKEGSDAVLFVFILLRLLLLCCCTNYQVQQPHLFSIEILRNHFYG